MNWLWDIIDPIKWKIEDFIWAIKDKIELRKELKDVDGEWDKIEDVEEIEVKPKKKKKKSVKKTKKSV